MRARDAGRRWTREERMDSDAVAHCGSHRCAAERRGFRRELNSWRHRLVHCVGFESILEGLYGPRLRRHLSLFEDCEPEELTDWSMDEKCSFCNLQREAVSSTPTEELSSQGQSNTEKIECEAENYLNALFRKKGPAHPRSSKSHIVSLHLLLSFLAVTTPFQFMNGIMMQEKRPGIQIPAPLGSLGIACGDRAENHSPTPPAAPAHPSPAVPAMATVR